MVRWFDVVDVILIFFAIHSIHLEVDDRCTTVCHMTRSKVKVKAFWSSENCTFLGLSLPFTIGAGKWPLIL